MAFHQRPQNNNKGAIKCSQINLQHCKAAALSLFEQVASSKQTNIALIQEPYCPFGRVSGIPPGLKLHVGTVGVRVRACIVSSENLEAWTLYQYSDRDMVTIAIRTAKHNNSDMLILASVYMPYDSPDPPPSQKLLQLVEYCRREGLRLIIGSDTNAHHTHWGSTNVNDRGDALLEYILGTDLTVCNQGNRPTFVTQNREEVIDVTLSTMNVQHCVTDWRVSRKDTYSDHRKITFVLDCQPTRVATKYRNVKSTDWEKYLNLLERKTGAMEAIAPHTKEGIELLANALEKSIISSYEASCKLVTKRRRKTPPWWSNELSELRKQGSKLMRRWSRNPTPENQTNWHNARREFKREVRLAKRDSWNNFCSSIETLPATSRLHRILKRSMKILQGTLKLPDGSYSVTPKETMEILLNAHFPDTEERLNDRENQRQMDNHQPMEIDLHSSFITKERVEAAIKAFSPYKAAGPDGISPILIQKGVEFLVDPLTALYKSCIGIGYVPKQWQRAKVVFLPKPGKDDYSDAKSYRPISLTNFLLKALERLVLWHLQEVPLVQFPLHRSQYAYKVGVSTEDALHNLVMRLEKAVYNRQTAIAVFLDIEGAFNNAQTTSMVQGLRRHGTRESITRWISFMLTHRVAETSMLGVHSKKEVTRGCPQGGILSPLLWNLIVDDLLEVTQGVVAIHGQAFADDVVACSSGPVPEVVGGTLQRALNRLNEWSTNHHLRFCPRKTKAVIFTRKKVEPPPLYLGRIRLEYSNQVKYLGLTLDRSLSWIPHVKEITRKAMNSLAQCRRAVGLTWGLTPKNMHWLYTTAIRPIVEYGCIIWNPSLKQATVQRLLSRVQRAACLAITSAFPGTATTALEAFLNIPPLHEFLKGAATAAAYRLNIRGNWLGKNYYIGSTKSHIETGNQLLREETLFLPADWCPKTPNFGNSFRWEIPEREHYSTLPPLEIVETEGKINCFTDGSKMESGSGAGIVIKGKDLSIEESMPLGTYPSVYQAELIAIAETSAKLSEMLIKGNSIDIYTDSRSSIEALTASFIRCETVKHCRDKLQQLCQDNEVTIKWIPGQAGLTGNELADQQAKSGSITPFTGPQPSIPIPISLAKRSIAMTVRKNHKAHWISRQDCRQSKMFCKEPKKARTQELLRLKRQEVRGVIQIMSGHANLARHRHICKKATSPICECGQAEETAFHYVADCQIYGPARLSIFNATHLSEEDLPGLHIHSLSAFNKRTKRLDKFVAEH